LSGLQLRTLMLTDESAEHYSFSTFAQMRC
jgi:hypothetical protein